MGGLSTQRELADTGCHNAPMNPTDLQGCITFYKKQSASKACCAARIPPVAVEKAPLNTPGACACLLWCLSPNSKASTSAGC